MEMFLVSRIVFSSTNDAEFAFSMVDRNSTPLDKCDVKEVYSGLYDDLYAVPFSDDPKVKDNMLLCEWTLCDFADAMDIVERLGGVEDANSLHYLDSDEDEPAIFIAFINGVKNIYSSWKGEEIQNWDAYELFDSYEKFSK